MHTLPVTTSTTDVSTATGQAFAERIAAEVTRRAAAPEGRWVRRSPTDVRTAAQINRDVDGVFLPSMVVAFASLGGGMGGSTALAAASHNPVLAGGALLAGVGAMCATLFETWKWPGRLSRRYRTHQALMEDGVWVPPVVAGAFDDVNEARAVLRSLSAPDMAIAYAVDAREQAADALIAVAALAKVSSDAVWLATTEPYQRIVTLASEVTVLEHLCKDRLALPHSVDAAVVPEGLQTAEEVGAYLLAENATVSRALAPAAGPNLT